MAKTAKLKQIKFPETVDSKFLEKTKKQLLDNKKDEKKYEITLKDVIEFDTSLFQFLVSVKKYTKENNIELTIKDIPHDGEKLLELYGYEM